LDGSPRRPRTRGHGISDVVLGALPPKRPSVVSAGLLDQLMVRRAGQIVVHGALMPVHTVTGTPCSPLSIPSRLSIWATSWQPVKYRVQSVGRQSPTWTTTVRSAGGGPQVQ